MSAPAHARAAARAARVGALVLMAAGAGTLGGSFSAAPAGAVTRTVGCAELQETMNQAAAQPGHGEGDVIVLEGMCDATNLKSSSGVTVPAGANFALEGKPGTTSGFDGTGVTQSLLATAGSEEAGALTLTDLTFAHADLNGASALSIHAARVTLSGDTFVENDARGANGHAAFIAIGASTCPPSSGPPAIAITGSRFVDNRLSLPSAEGGGAGAWLQDPCDAAANQLEGDNFEGNVLEASGTPQGRAVTGAGLEFVGSEDEPAPLTQRANVFDSNRIAAAAPAEGNYGGGGEWVRSANLFSVGDRFSRNAIAGTASTNESSWSWGAGLGIIVPSETSACNPSVSSQSTLQDAVVTGNAIGPGTSALLGGGGLWVGCITIRILDSTVTQNAAPVGSGIEGEPQSRLEMGNSIVAGDSGGNETAGFEGDGGSRTVAYSDVCAVTTSTEALPGAGNICAKPHLTNEGNSASVDVHETAASPTIDAGSNLLVPAGLSTDFFGDPRILAGRSIVPTCIPPEIVHPVAGPAVVDMGASEFGPVVVPQTAILCTVTGESAFALPKVIDGTKGTLVLKFPQLGTGTVHVRATAKVTVPAVKGTKARPHQAKRTVLIPYGQVTRLVTKTGKVTLTLTPTIQARGSLARRGQLRVRLAITFKASGASPQTRVETVTVKFRAPTRRSRS